MLRKQQNVMIHDTVDDPMAVLCNSCIANSVDKFPLHNGVPISW